MAYTLALSVAVQRARQRARREGDDAISAAESKALMSEVYAELVSVFHDVGNRYFAAEQSITANGAASYALTSDHRDTFAVDRVLDTAGRRTALDLIMFQERNLYVGQTGDAVAYELEGANLILYPKPSTGSYKHVYQPQPTDLSSAADSTSVDFVTSDGLAFALWAFALLARDKEESELLSAVRFRDEAKDRLTAWAVQHRTPLAPRRPIVRNAITSDVEPNDWLLPDWWRYTP